MSRNSTFILVCCIAFSSLVACIKINFKKSDAKKVYSTLCKKGPWNVKKMTITRYDGEYDSSPILWDTVIYDLGSITFEKDKYEAFSCVLTFSTGDKLKMNAETGGKLEKDNLYLNFYHPINGKAFQPSYGSGKLDTKKGKSLKISGKIYFWDVNNSAEAYFPFAKTITEEAYYKCDWELEAN